MSDRQPSQQGAPYQPPRRPSQRPLPSEELRRDTEAAYAARLELGPAYENSIADGLADRVEQLAAYRVAELRQTNEVQRLEVEDARVNRRNRFVLGIVSVGAGIPITAISGALTDLPGLVVSWAGIVGVNVVHALASRRQR